MDTQNPEQNSPEVSPDEALPVETAEGQIAALTADRDRLACENGDLQDRLLRARAEFDNARRRMERERSEIFQFAAMDMVKQLLPVLDDFERALGAQTADKDYARGVELIYTRLFDNLKKQGLEPIEAKGKKFDPNVHEAVQRVETSDAEDQTVLEELQRGYQFKGKLLRPSWVKVAVQP